jgi:hypothetical protein
MQRISVVVLGLLLALTLIFVAASVQAAEEKPITVEKIVAATGVENKEAVGEAAEFELAAGKVYCWTKVTLKTPPATIKHVWYLDEKKVFEQPLELKFPSVRTWSYKTVKAGKWKVEVTDEAGAVLSSVEFTVKQ